MCVFVYVSVCVWYGGFLIKAGSWGGWKSFRNKISGGRDGYLGPKTITLKLTKLNC